MHTDENREFEKQFGRWQRRQSRLVNSDFYDSIKVTEVEYSILRQIGEAETYHDINVYLWNNGMIDVVLNNISRKIKEVRAEYNRQARKRK